MKSKEVDHQETLTIRHLASLCGCSKSTVARVLQKHPQVAAKTRERVLKIIKEEGYKPDPKIVELMKRLRMPRAERASVNMAWLRYGENPSVPQKTPWFRDLWEAACQQSKELGFTFDQLLFKSSECTLKRMHEILIARGIVGLLQGPPWQAADFDGFDDRAFSIVVAGESDTHHVYHRVGQNHFHNTGILLEKLRAKGYRRFGLVASAYLHRVTGEQLVARMAYEHAQSTAEEYLPWDKDIPYAGPKFEKWLSTQQPDVIICGDNQMLDTLQKIGLRVPEDIGLVHLNLASDCAGWAGIDQNHHIVGAQAIQLLANLMQRGERGRPKNPIEIMIPGKFVDGFTVRPDL